MVFSHTKAEQNKPHLFFTDCTANPRPYAKTIQQRGIVHSPNPAPGNKPICVGHQYSLLAMSPQGERSKNGRWLIPISMKRVDFKCLNQTDWLNIYYCFLDDEDEIEPRSDTINQKSNAVLVLGLNPSSEPVLKISGGMTLGIPGQAGMYKMGLVCRNYSNWVDGLVLRWFCVMLIYLEIY